MLKYLCLASDTCLTVDPRCVWVKGEWKHWGVEHVIVCPSNDIQCALTVMSSWMAQLAENKKQIQCGSSGKSLHPAACLGLPDPTQIQGWVRKGIRTESLWQPQKVNNVLQQWWSDWAALHPAAQQQDEHDFPEQSDREPDRRAIGINGSVSKGLLNSIKVEALPTLLGGPLLACRDPSALHSQLRLISMILQLQTDSSKVFWRKVRSKPSTHSNHHSILQVDSPLGHVLKRHFMWMRWWGTYTYSSHGDLSILYDL